MPYLLTVWLILGAFVGVAFPRPADTIGVDADDLALARQYEEQEKFSQAIEHYERARASFAASRSDGRLVYVLNRLASLYAADSTTQPKAEAYLDSAQVLLQSPLPEDDTLHALTWSTRGELASARRQFDEAIEHYQKALKLKQAFYGENHLEVADEMQRIGNIYLYDLLNPYESERFHKQALEIRILLDDTSRLLINCRYHLVNANQRRGDYEEALAYGFEVLNDYKSSPEEEYYFYNMAAATSLLGIVYYGMDSIKDALYYNKEAITLAISGDLSQSLNMSALYNNQAEYHYQAQAYDSTIYYANLSIANYPEIDDLGNSYQFLGNAYRGKGQLSLAFRNYRKSKLLKERTFANHHTQLATLYVDLGEAFTIGHQLDSALYYYRKALVSAKISRQDDHLDTELSIQAGDDLTSIQEALSGIVNVLVLQHAQTNNLDYLKQALPYFMLFDHFMDLSRASFSTESAKLLLSGNHKATYERAIASCYSLYQATGADSLLQSVYHYMEKSKAIVLLESIYQANHYQGVLPDSLVQQDQSLRAQLAYIQSEIIKAKQSNTSASSVSDWQQRKAEVLSKLELIRQHIQAHYPSYYDVTNQNLTIQLDSLQMRIPANQPIISYFEGDSAVYTLMIKSDDIKIHQIKNTVALKQAINDYRGALLDDVVYDPSYAYFLQYQESALTLYKLLLDPLIAGDTIEHLTIISDESLTTIPFEGLITSSVATKKNDIRYEKLPFLIKSYGISYEFSISVAFLEKRNSEIVLDDDIAVIAFGIKDFSSLSDGQRYSRLEGAEHEVKYVKKKFPQARIFLNAKATEKQFKRYAPEADILHVATHGMADYSNPFDSKFIFYSDLEEDGILHLHELYDMPLKAQLLLLSACESGVGKYFAGEGNFSMARSFVYAGCTSVLMALWQVNDNTTKRIVEGVYDQLAQQHTVNEAIRNTKLAFIENGALAHPQYWAGMVPLGNTNVQFSEPKLYAGALTNAILVVSIVSVLLLVWIFLKTRK